MIKQDKELLLKDLCGRLPYGVRVLSNESHIIATLLRGGKYDDGETYFIVTHIGCALKIDEFKPYLRPMSSMTEEELQEYDTICTKLLNQYKDYPKNSLWVMTYTDSEMFDFFNANHFDYHRLIEKGLALEAPEGMYKIE